MDITGNSDTHENIGELNQYSKCDSSVGRNTSVIGSNLYLTDHSEWDFKESTDMSEYSFDNVIGHLEDMLIDENFHTLQNSFFEKHWQEFEDSEENKHSYMIIFSEYTKQIEGFITSYLQKRLKNFEMDKFVSELEQRKDELEGEVFEVLLTVSDFRAFKEILLDYRAMKEGRAIDLRESLFVSSVSL